MKKPDPGSRVEDILAFYRDRGYNRRVGGGRSPAVLVIDFSLAFTGGRTDFPGGDFAAEIRETLRMLEVARRRGFPVLFTTIAYDEPHRDAGMWGRKVPWLEHCKTGSQLVEIDPLLDVRPGEPVVVKKFPSSFFGTNLDAVLTEQRVDTLVIAGCTTSVCVRATAIDAMQRGLHTIVAADAVGDFDAALHAVHLADLDSRYADAIHAPELLRYLEEAPGQ